MVALTSVLAASLFVPNVARAEDSAQDRYHRAYELEVVDGKVADAARAYLALIDDADAPENVRGESRFRFAICSVLLGRSDEARRLLGELADDTGSSDALRARAREYQKAIFEIGIGSEIDKKLQSLLFELGRASMGDQSLPVYRDFAILGDAARPFLIKLLDHSDVTLAKHAMRILCRMDEPNLMSRWTARIGLDRTYPGLDIRNYLNSHADQIPVLEEKLQALDAKTLDRTLRFMSGPIPFSTTFAASLQPGPVGKGALFTVLQGQPRREQWQLLTRWMTADDTAIASASAVRLLELALSEIPDGEPSAGLVLLATRRTLGVFALYRGDAPRWTLGLRALAQQADANEVIEALKSVVDVSRNWSDPDSSSPVERGIGRLFVNVLNKRSLDEIDTQRHADTVIAHIRVAHANYVTRRDAADGTSQRDFQLSSTEWSSARRALRRLDSAQQRAAVDALFDGLDDVESARLLGALPLEQEALATRALALLDRLPPASRLVALNRLAIVDASMRLGSAPAAVYSVGFARILLQTLPGLVRVEEAASLQSSFLGALVVVGVPESTEPLVRYVRARATLQNPDWHPIFKADFSRPWGLAKIRVFAPALTELFEVVRTDAGRSAIVDLALSAVSAEREQRLDLGDDRAPIVSFVRGHYASVGTWWVSLAKSSDLFPITDWVRHIRSGMWPGLLNNEVGSERMNTAARALAAASEPPNDAVVAFIVKMTSPDVRDEVVDRMLRETPPAQLYPVTRVLRGRGVNVGSISAIEIAVSRLISDADSDWRAVSAATSVLAERHPTPALFPAARWLLARPERAAVLRGIAQADSLGRTELIPDLIAKLDSMDSEVRTKAREAIDAILELERLRKEARERFGKSGSERDK